MSLLAHTSAEGQPSATTPAVNTTGAALLVAAVAWYGATPTLSDNQGNTWVLADSASYYGTLQLGLWYVASPTTSSSHTFAFAGATSSAALAIQVFSAITSSPLDVENETVLTFTNTGSCGVTPSQSSELVVTCYAAYGSSSKSISSPYAITDVASVPSNGPQVGAAYALGVTGATSPTWTTNSSGSVFEIVTAAFIPGSPSPPPGVHTVTGTGSVAISSPAWLSTAISGRPITLTAGNANPRNWFHVGQLSWGTSTHGAMTSYPITRDLDLVELPAGMTTLWYALASGVTAVITELASP